MYSFNAYIVEKSSRVIVDNMDDKFEDIEDKFSDIDTKLQTIENLINLKLEVCYKRVNDIYSMQNKANEINKMNNQSINRQINQYDEEIEDIDINQKNAVFNSLETSVSPHSKFEKYNNQCFIKHRDTKKPDRDMFYMSSLNKNEFQSKNKTEHSTTSVDTSLSKKAEQIKTDYLNKNKEITCSTTSTTSTNKSASKKQNVENKSSENNVFENIYKNNKKQNIRIVKDNISLENDSNLEEFINSLPENVVDSFFQKNKANPDLSIATDTKSNVILEMNSETVKPYKVETSSPKFANAMKILNETNFIKNNSHNKLNELNEKDEKHESSDNTSSTNNIDNTSNSDNFESEMNIDEFAKNINFVKIMDLAGTNIIFKDIFQKPNNEKIVELK